MALHAAVFHQTSYHHDGPNVLLPHHPPKVVAGYWRGALRCNVPVGVAVGVNDEIGIDISRELLLALLLEQHPGVSVGQYVAVTVEPHHRDRIARERVKVSGVLRQRHEIAVGERVNRHRFDRWELLWVHELALQREPVPGRGVFLTLLVRLVHTIGGFKFFSVGHHLLGQGRRALDVGGDGVVAQELLQRGLLPAPLDDRRDDHQADDNRKYPPVLLNECALLIIVVAGDSRGRIVLGHEVDQTLMGGVGAAAAIHGRRRQRQDLGGGIFSETAGAEPVASVRIELACQRSIAGADVAKAVGTRDVGVANRVGAAFCAACCGSVAVGTDEVAGVRVILAGQFGRRSVAVACVADCVALVGGTPRVVADANGVGFAVSLARRTCSGDLRTSRVGTLHSRHLRHRRRRGDGGFRTADFAVVVPGPRLARLVARVPSPDTDVAEHWAPDTGLETAELDGAEIRVALAVAVVQRRATRHRSRRQGRRRGRRGRLRRAYRWPDGRRRGWRRCGRCRARR